VAPAPHATPSHVASQVTRVGEEEAGEQGGGGGRGRTSSYASRRAHCSSDSPMSLRPRGRNHERWAVSFTTTTLPEDGWMTTMLAPSTKSCVQKQLFGIDSVEKSEYRLGWNAPLLLLLLVLLLLLPVLLPSEDAAAASAVLVPVPVDSRLERNSGMRGGSKKGGETEGVFQTDRPNTG
jgi:hypothetical protein